MGNGIRCCLTGVCCSKAKQRAALVKALRGEAGVDEVQSERAAEWIIEHLSVDEVLGAVADTVRKHKDEAA